MLTSLRSSLRTARLEGLRCEHRAAILGRLEASGRPVRVAAYVLAGPGRERQADVELLARYAERMGWKVAGSSFADVGEPPPLAGRAGFAAACRYAAQGYAHGILALARPALTTDNDAYAHVLEYLHTRGVFLDYPPSAPTP
ncbi:hypothetical protein [Streptomyces griseoaurantiacus]|uniref:hypothetical protein n=1 Tax=Streptomyces griseoaurantiacus TaxID=68213 RepID=UPI00177CE8DD|nr:hypothetical protein GCM10018782_10590 [Streptomyces griseoaurantiacus]